jgi:hypothetical protein
MTKKGRVPVYLFRYRTAGAAARDHLSLFGAVEQKRLLIETLPIKSTTPVPVVNQIRTYW